MTQGIALLVCVVSFAFLAPAMERHQETLFGRELSRGQSRAFRTAGWCGLVLALRYLVGGEGWALGLVSFSGCTSLAAGIVYGALILLERREVRG
ncbi:MULTISPECIES: DUF3325 domain-containing protein [unclassified Caballeronia]|uniref:DUF3325 domain-containing protein n=1 Tax=unclassified Caballeronia TaxID=2646786 RepID=UPI002867A0AB|nr:MULTISPECIES: DUF3325 domain-containing protein [unclassified Caballeronia]MDR5773943.1 DUF3325 domain-containing protein [Caballeronia sp. LZ002]MDR5849378.1 DUF3325 domain-containing protein [Caballeronia sp. LZ003]